MPFQDTNESVGLNRNDDFQVGRSEVDPTNGVFEEGKLIPWASEKEASWIYFNCLVGVMLDSGLVVHNRLPQVNRAPDTLASVQLDDPGLDGALGSLNLKCQDQYEDIVQRMGHSRYWFRLWGQAMRVGYKIPIPGISTIGGVPAIPYDKNPQWAFCSMVPGGNMGGLVIWRAAWSLWYTTAVPPVNNVVPIADPSAHIASDASLPNGVQLPYSRPDDNFKKAKPGAKR